MKKYSITVNGNTYEVTVEEIDGSSHSHTPLYSAPVTAKTTQNEIPQAAPSGVSVTSPMPGTILEVKVSVGQAIKKGDVLCVLEAMKMENDIPAPCDGVVSAVNVQKGSNVATNEIIISLN